MLIHFITRLTKISRIYIGNSFFVLFSFFLLDFLCAIFGFEFAAFSFIMFNLHLRPSVILVNMVLLA